MDPSSRDRIDRMEADGLITARQAEMLRASMSAGAARRETAPPRRSPGILWLVGGLVVVVALVSIVAMPAGGPVEVQDVADSLNQPDGVGAMNRSLMTALVAILFVALGAGLFLWSYNGLVNREEQVFAAGARWKAICSGAPT